MADPHIIALGIARL